MSLFLKAFVLSIFVNLLVIFTLALFGLSLGVLSGPLGMVSFFMCFSFLEKFED